jgi:hypothetical protein
MPNLIVALLDSVPDFGDESKAAGPEAKQARPPRQLQLDEIHGMLTAGAHLNNLISHLYGALLFAGLEQNADNLLPFLIQLLPQEPPQLKTLKNRAALLNEYFEDQREQQETSYHALTLFSALSKAGENPAAAYKSVKEQARLGDLTHRARQVVLILGQQAQAFDRELAGALEADQSQLNLIEEKLNRLVKKEKTSLQTEMARAQQVVLNQAEPRNYILLVYALFNPSYQTAANSCSAFLSEALFLFELFELRQLGFEGLVNRIGGVYKRAKEAGLNGGANLTLLVAGKNLLMVRKEAEKLEREFWEKRGKLMEKEKLLRANKMKRALREWEQEEAKRVEEVAEEEATLRAVASLLR